jgi:signal transduction histidine kinase
MSSEEPLLPNYSKLDTALRSIGYSFESAVADVVDNAIDAQARNVLVRLILRRDGRLDLVIRDDGQGMDSQVLREAMRFGSDISGELRRLGKFGLGLKLASLSQARSLTVISSRGKTLRGRS